MTLLIIHIIPDWEEAYAEDSLVTRFSSPSSLVVRFVRESVTKLRRARDVETDGRTKSGKEEENDVALSLGHGQGERERRAHAQKSKKWLWGLGGVAGE